MSKWKCEICGSEFNNFHAQGFNHKIYCPLCYFKEDCRRLRKENKKLKGALKTHEILLKVNSEKSNVLDKLEEWLDIREKEVWDSVAIDMIIETRFKIQELKGESNNG